MIISKLLSVLEDEINDYYSNPDYDWTEKFNETEWIIITVRCPYMYAGIAVPTGLPPIVYSSIVKFINNVAHTPITEINDKFNICELSTNPDFFHIFKFRDTEIVIHGISEHDLYDCLGMAKLTNLKYIIYNQLSASAYDIISTEIATRYMELVEYHLNKENILQNEIIKHYIKSTEL